MALGGAAWVCAFSVLNVAAQLSVPRWVQGRALAVYQIAVQGGLAGASVLWGWIGERYGLQPALWCGAASIVAGFATYRWSLAAADDVQTDPVTRPHPTVVMQVDPNAGPALVTVEYRINLDLADEFVGAMAQMRRIRLRDGAVFWGLFVDLNRPDRFVEQFITETWVEHLRQHDRMIASDMVYESRAKSFHLGDDTPVTHLISAHSVVQHNPGSFKRGGAITQTIETELVLKKVLP
jgi:hypothetical protein